jgi:hypothetical protein
MVSESRVAVAEAREQFGIQEEGLEAVTRQRLVKTQQAEETEVCALVNSMKCVN